MIRFPPTPPTWDAWHPILVHFPIGLLPTAGVLVLLALILRKHANPLNLAALVVMVLGTVGLFLAFSSGEAAEEFAPDQPAIHAAVHEHEEAAEAARITFLCFTIAFALYALALWFVSKPKARAWITGVGVAFLVGYLVPCLMLMNAGHLGGQLVHVHGVHARLGPSAGQASPTSSAESRRHHDD